VLLFRIHEFAVSLLIPPGVTKIWIHKQVPLMHMAIHALAGGNRTCELMDDGVSALGFWNRFVSREAQTLVSVLAPPTGIGRRSVVGIDDMACRTAA
jgi:hypothetical protein